MDNVLAETYFSYVVNFQKYKILEPSIGLYLLFSMYALNIIISHLIGFLYIVHTLTLVNHTYIG